MQKVIVIGCYVMGYGVIRSLADKGFEIIALTYDNADFAHRSKYVSQWFSIPHPRLDEINFINFLLDKVKHWEGSVIFDTDDTIATAISKNKNILSKYYKIVAADWEMVNIFLDKKNAWQIALNAGVPHPKNFIPKTKADFDEIKNKIKLPCLFKPIHGHEFKEILKVKNFVANSFDEYDEYSDICLKNKQEVMVQEIISGPDTKIFKCMTYINSKGNYSGLFFYNKVRQNPPGYGVHRVCMSAAYNAQIEDLFKKLIDAAGYRGFLTVEFKEDPRDGQLKFIECNVRMPRNIYLPTAAGVNFPWIITSDLLFDKQIYFKSYNDQMYWIEIISDLLNSVFRHSKENFRLKDYLQPYLSSDKVYAIFNMKDPLPFVISLSKLYRFLL